MNSFVDLQAGATLCRPSQLLWAVRLGVWVGGLEGVQFRQGIDDPCNSRELAHVHLEPGKTSSSISDTNVTLPGKTRCIEDQTVFS